MEELDEVFNPKKLYFESERSKKDDLYFVYAVNDRSFVSRRHYHQSIEIEYVIKGRVGCMVDGSLQYVSKDEILYINSWDIHFFDIQEKNETLTMVIGIDYLRDFYSVYGKKEKMPYFDSVLRNKKVNRKILENLMRWKRDFSQEDIICNRGYINLLLGELAREYPVHCEERARKRNDTVNYMLQYIDEHYMEKITLEDAARNVGYRPNYCSKLFHESVGQDFRNYVNGVRLEAVRRIALERPDRKITDIAFECGFCSLNTFYRTFNRVYKKKM